MKPRPPRKRPSSRRGDPRAGLSARSVGPENLPAAQYEVSIVFVCSGDGQEMGRASRLTCPDLPAEMRETSTRALKTGVIDESTGKIAAVLPIVESEDYSKWRFVCHRCGRDVPKSSARVEAALDALCEPWARRVVKYPL